MSSRRKDVLLETPEEAKAKHEMISNKTGISIETVRLWDTAKTVWELIKRKKGLNKSFVERFKFKSKMVFSLFVLAGHTCLVKTVKFTFSWKN